MSELQVLGGDLDSQNLDAYLSKVHCIKLTMAIFEKADA